MKEKIRKDSILQIIGNNIKALRLSKGMTQEEMAEKLDRSVNFVSLIELGKSGMSAATMIDICNILEIDANYIFRGLLDYEIKDSDKKLMDSIIILSDDDKIIIESLIEHLLKKGN